MKYVVSSTSTYPENLGSGGQLPAELRGWVCLFLSVFFVCPSRYDARHRKPRRFVYALNFGGTGISPRTILVIVPIFVFVPVFVLVLVLVLQQAATYSIAAVAGNWTILVRPFSFSHCYSAYNCFVYLTLLFYFPQEVLRPSVFVCYGSLTVHSFVRSL